MDNEFIKCWDKYISDSDEQYTDLEYIAFKNGWVYALDHILNNGRSLYNDAIMPERKNHRLL